MTTGVEMNFNHVQGLPLAQTTRNLLKEHGSTLSSDRVVAWLVPTLSDHCDAVDVGGTVSDPEQLVATLTTVIARHDLKHDHLFRALLYLLRAARHLSLSADPDRPDAAATWDALLALLAPDGGAQVGKAFEVEAADAPRRWDAVGAPLRAALATLALGPVNGVAVAERWVQMAGELGLTLTQRGSAQALVDGGIDGSAARRALIDDVNLLVSLLPRSGVPGPVQAAITGAYEELIAAAERRAQEARRREKAKAEAAPAPAPQSAEPTLE